MRRSPVPFLLLLLVASTTPVVALEDGPGQDLSPRRLRVGEVAHLRVTTSGFASVDALAATTVHAPTGEGVRVVSRRLSLSFGDAGAWRRTDEFELVPERPGEIPLRGAVVEHPGRGPYVLPPLGLTVEAASGRPSPVGLAAAGLASLLFGIGLWEQKVRRSRDQARGSALCEGPELEVRLPEAIREARIRGDVRGFHAALHSALRRILRTVSGVPVRDPRSLESAARVAGIPGEAAIRLRQVMERSERVAFGGESLDPAQMGPTLETVEAILATLVSRRAGDREGSQG